VLTNPSSRALAERFLQDLRPAAHTLGMQLHVLNASSKRDFDTVFAALAKVQAAALLICPDVFSTLRSSSSPRSEFATPCPWPTSIVHSSKPVGY
jgi:putative ABC transport system substrate-binding protein